MNIGRLFAAGHLSTKGSRSLLSLVVIVSCGLLFFARGVFFDGRTILWDAADEFFPTMWYTGELWRSGTVPLWNPFLFNGYPLFADPQNQTFYPVNLLISLLTHFSARVVYLQLVLHFILAGVFMYLFTGLYVRSNAGRLVAALLYMCNGFMITHFQHLTVIDSVVWLPLVLFLLGMGWRDRSLRYFFPAGISFAVLILAGHPQSLIAISYILLLFGVFQCLWPSPGERVSFFPLKLTLVSMVFGALLGAIQLIPSYEFSTMANRSGALSYGIAALASGQFPPAHLATLFLPDYFGTVRGPYSGMTDITYSSIYCGIVFLGVLPYSFAQRRKEVYFFGLMGLLTLLVSMGDYGFIFRLVHRYLPGFDLFRSPAHYRFGFVFFAAILAGIGVDTLAEEEGPRIPGKRIRRLYGAGLLLIVAALAVLRLLFPAGGHAPLEVLRGALLFYALYAFFSAALVLREKKKIPVYIFQVAILLLAFGDFYGNGADARSVGADAKHASLGPPAIGTLLKEDGAQSGAGGEENPFSVSPRRLERGLYRVYVNDDPASLLRALPYIPYSYLKLGVVGFNRILLDEIFMVDGYNPMMLRRYVFFNGVLRDENYPRFLMLSNVNYVVEPDGRVRAIPQSETLPRAYLVNNIEYVKDAGAILDRLAEPSFDPRRTAIVEKEAILPPGLVPEDTGTARIVAYAPGRVTIITTGRRPALVVLGDSYYPGWRYSLDSRAATDALRVDYCFMGAPVPPGRHTVNFEFSPASIRLASAVSLSSFLIGLFFFWRGRRGRKRNRVPRRS